MKKLLAIALCVIMVAAVAASAVSAYDYDVIDVRDLREYGQQYLYLDAPVDGVNIPNAHDGKVNEGEYYLTYTYTEDDLCAEVTDAAKSATFYDNVDGADIHMSYDEETLYVALVTKDPNYVVGKDGSAFNICFRNGPRPTDSVSRLCFNIYGAGDGTDMYNYTVKCSYMVKNDDGSWQDMRYTDGTEHIKDMSVSYDPETCLFTTEVAFDLLSQKEYWDNDLPLEEVRMFFVPYVYMYGESVKGAGDVVLQGVLWSYLPSGISNEMRMRFSVDYPDTTYWCSFFPNIVRFCEKSADTTTARSTVTTTTVKLTLPPVPATTTVAPTDAPTDAPKADATTAAEKEKGCASTVALSALAIVPMLGAAVVFGKKKED